MAYTNFLKRRNMTADLPAGGYSYKSILSAQQMMDNELRCLKDKQKTEEVGGSPGCRWGGHVTIPLHPRWFFQRRRAPL